MLEPQDLANMIFYSEDYQKIRKQLGDRGERYLSIPAAEWFSGGVFFFAVLTLVAEFSDTLDFVTFIGSRFRRTKGMVCASPDDS